MWRAALLLREWLTRLRNSLWPHRSDADLEAELQSHLELAQEAASADLARDTVRRTRLRAGGVPQATEAMRDQRGLRWLEDFGRDLRYAGRMMAKQPGFTAIAAASLALGVGANTAAFSWAGALLLRPLPIPRPADLLTVGFQASHATGSLSSHIASSSTSESVRRAFLDSPPSRVWRARWRTTLRRTDTGGTAPA